MPDCTPRNWDPLPWMDLLNPYVISRADTGTRADAPLGEKGRENALHFAPVQKPERLFTGITEGQAEELFTCSVQGTQFLSSNRMPRYHNCGFVSGQLLKQGC
jgi:hypothetical protein